MVRVFTRLGFLAAAVALAAAPAVRSADPPAKADSKDKKGPYNPGRVEVEEAKNAAWKVSVTVDRSDATYAFNDEVFITVTSEQAGYLYVFNADTAGNIVCLYPNQYQGNIDIAANTPVTIPDPKNPKFRLRAVAPAGRELVKAVVTKEPLREIDPKDFSRAAVTPVDRQKFVRLVTEAMGGDPTAVPQDTPQGPDKPPKPEVIVQKQKIEKEKPEIYVKKKKEWATGEVELTVVAAKVKPDQKQDK